MYFLKSSSWLWCGEQTEGNQGRNQSCHSGPLGDDPAPHMGLGLRKLLKLSCKDPVWDPRLRQEGVVPRSPATPSH